MKLKFKDNSTGIVHVFDASEIEVQVEDDSDKKEGVLLGGGVQLSLRGVYSIGQEVVR